MVGAAAERKSWLCWIHRVAVGLCLLAWWPLHVGGRIWLFGVWRSSEEGWALGSRRPLGRWRVSTESAACPCVCRLFWPARPRSQSCARPRRRYGVFHAPHGRDGLGCLPGPAYCWRARIPEWVVESVFWDDGRRKRAPASCVAASGCGARLIGVVIGPGCLQSCCMHPAPPLLYANHTSPCHGFSWFARMQTALRWARRV